MTYQITQVALPAGPLTCHTAGAGRPLLYLHAAGGFSVSPPLQTLAQTHQVWAPVTPGFDGTDRLEGVNSVRDYAGIVADLATNHIGPRFDVIGASFGSWVAMWLAVLHPQAVDRLILQVPAGFRFGGKGGVPDDPAGRLAALHAHPERITARPKPPAAMAANRRTYDAMTALPGGATVDEDLSAALAQIRARTLILLGSVDPVVPPEAAAHLERQIPGARCVTVPDAAHSLELDQPETVLRLWTGFLDRSAAP